MLNSAAKTVALSLLRLLEDKESRDSAMHEFNQRTGGGVSGDRWIKALCDYQPPVNFRWPEYVTTHRGRDWWIPAQGY